MLYNIYNIYQLYDKYYIYKIYKSCMLYNSQVVNQLSLSKFRNAIRAVVRKAEDGEPTILTHYRRQVAAIVPMKMFVPPEKKGSASEPTPKSRNRVS